MQGNNTPRIRIIQGKMMFFSGSWRSYEEMDLGGTTADGAEYPTMALRTDRDGMLIVRKLTCDTATMVDSVIGTSSIGGPEPHEENPVSMDVDTFVDSQVIVSGVARAAELILAEQEDQSITKQLRFIVVNGQRYLVTS